MSLIYEKAPEEVNSLITKVMEKYHNELFIAGVKVAATMVSKLGKEDELVPCLKVRGAQAYACIHTVRPSQRLRVQHDAELTIDAFLWEDMGMPQKIAILDHELTHLAIRLDKQGKPKLDDHGFIRLRCVNHDYDISGFYQIVRRHGMKSIEWNRVSSVYNAVEKEILEWQKTATPETQPDEIKTELTVA